MPHLDILANVGLVLRIQGTPRDQREAVATKTLSLVGLDPDRFGQL